MINVDRAIILAAGYGKRMMPLTQRLPKPLIAVAGKPMIDYAYERLAADGVSQVVINVHYLPEPLISWARSKTTPPVLISDETGLLLDTGGGVVNAIGLLGAEPFFILNGDSFWLESRMPVLARLRELFDPGKMDGLLLLSRTSQAVGYDGAGDFHFGTDGRIGRRGLAGVEAFAFAGCQLVRPALFTGAPAGPFSTNMMWDRAIRDGRLFGVVHDDLWLHVGTPQAIPLAEAAIASHPGQR